MIKNSLMMDCSFLHKLLMLKLVDQARVFLTDLQKVEWV